MPSMQTVSRVITAICFKHTKSVQVSKPSSLQLREGLALAGGGGGGGGEVHTLSVGNLVH